MTANAAEVSPIDTEITRLKELFSRQKSAFSNNPMPSAEQRIGHLKALKSVICQLHLRHLIPTRVRIFLYLSKVSGS